MKRFCLGLTGSIGMGKSTTAGFFVEAGIPLWDADAAVHRIYAAGGSGAAALAADFPTAVQNGGVSRETLKAILAEHPALLTRLEAVVHPLVAADRRAFLDQAQADIVVLDVPLLFEKGNESLCDAVLVCTAPQVVQRARVLARPGMTPEQFAFILSRQMPDRDKRLRADHLVETLSLASTKAYVEALITHIREKLWQADA